MIIGVITEAAVGLLCIIFGLLLWKKQTISLLHDYHYKNVKKEDIPAYTKKMGIGLISVGAGVLITGIINLFQKSIWWLPMVIGFVLGVAVMGKAQKKYNGSWF